MRRNAIECFASDLAIKKVMHMFISVLILGSFHFLPLKNDQVLNVQISGIKEVVGVMRVGLFANEEDFLEHSYRSMNVEVRENELQITFENVPSGRYAISIYHDTNSNGVLDSNLFKIPKEPYGFSNNPPSFFGPPDFEAASFVHGDDDTQLEIKLK